MVEQVLFDILLYLPIMSLLRFKSVCKSWFSLIESSTFITQHLKYNSGKEDNIIIFHRHRILDDELDDEMFLRHRILDDEMLQLLMLSGNQYEDCVNINFEQLLWHPAFEVEFIGSCNGILCLYHGRHPDFALWNPALKQLRHLPQPLFSGSDWTRYFIAFGIDATNDFKVLRISFIYSGEYYDKMLGNQAEVYNLRDNSWRITHKDDVLLFAKKPSFTQSKSTGGKCFWMAHEYDKSQMLLSFDFNDEVFGTMVLPDVDSSDHCYHYLDICNDKLVYIRVQTGYSIYEIWIVQEYGVKESWNKLYNAGSLSHLGSIFPLGLSRNAEFLIFSRFDIKDSKLYLYNLHTQEGQFLQYVVTCNLIHYNASLISVKSANGI